MNDLVNGKIEISSEMAIRLDKAFGVGSETWLRLQAAYNLRQTKKNAKNIKVKWYAQKSDEVYV